MFQTKLLKSALVAISVIKMVTKAKTTHADIIAYPEFELAMFHEGSFFSWKSVDVETTTGYNLKMFRITEGY